MDDAAKVKYLIENNDFMIVATADSNGKPWISPVGFSADGKFNLYWVSDIGSLHSRNISKRPEVAIVIIGKLPDGAMDGVYFDASAKEIDKDEIDHAIEVLAKRPKDPKFDVNSRSQVTGEAVWRIYKASPVNITKRADETRKGQAVTVRKDIELL